MRLTAIAHEKVAAALRPGDFAIDATAGNGYDTTFLANAVGDDGKIWAFDIQEAAITSTQARLEEQGIRQRVTLVHSGHETMSDRIPKTAAGKIGAVMFNLGYLPGADHALTTNAATTLRALDAAFALLRPGGILSAMLYVGHPGGHEEALAVMDWAREIEGSEILPPGDPQSSTRPSPGLAMVWRLQPDIPWRQVEPLSPVH